MKWYRRHITDYIMSTRGLTMLQDGAYNRLLDGVYERERFPTQEQAIMWTGATGDDECRAVVYILQRFFDLGEDGVYRHERIQAEIDHYHAKCATNKKVAVDREGERRAKRAKPDETPESGQAQAAPRPSPPPSAPAPQPAPAEAAAPEAAPTPPKPAPKRAVAVTALDEELPEGVNREALSQWLNYRRQINKPIRTPSIAALIRKLITFGEHQAAAVEESISNGWEGLFMPKHLQAAKTGKPNRAATRSEVEDRNQSVANQIIAEHQAQMRGAETHITPPLLGLDAPHPRGPLQ